MQQRPANVPRSAVYSKHDRWWQLGEVRDGRAFGSWRTFRDDGSPLFEARFDTKGRLQGTFKRFHPDGTVAREGAYHAGTPAGEHVYHRGAGDLFPCGDPRVHQVRVRHDSNGGEAERVLLDERGHELEAARRGARRSAARG